LAVAAKRVTADTGGEFLRMFAKVPGSSASMVRLQTNAWS
jgi:hypothetical protein